MAVLGTAIHVVPTNDGDLYGGGDARPKAGHDVLRLTTAQTRQLAIRLTCPSPGFAFQATRNERIEMEPMSMDALKKRMSSPLSAAPRANSIGQ